MWSECKECNWLSDYLLFDVSHIYNKNKNNNKENRTTTTLNKHIVIVRYDSQTADYSALSEYYGRYYPIPGLG